MHHKKYFRVALALFLTVTLSSLIGSHKADAHAPVAFIIQPYYGAHGYFQRWVAGSHYGIDFMMDW